MEKGKKTESILYILILQSFWFPTSLTLTLILSVVLPAGVDSDSDFAVCVVLGSLAQLIGPIAAASSDGHSFFNIWTRCNTCLDSMSCAVLVGTMLSIPGLYYIMISQKNYALGYTLYQLGSTLAVQPYTGLVPKLVSKKYEGRGSGIMVVYTSLGSIVACVFGILIGSDVMGMICLIRGKYLSRYHVTLKYAGTSTCGYILILLNVIGAVLVILSLAPMKDHLMHNRQEIARPFCTEIQSFMNTFSRESLFRTLFVIWGLVSVAQYVPLLLVENDLKRESWNSTYTFFSFVISNSKETSTSICTLLSLVLSFVSAAWTGHVMDLNERVTRKIVIWGTCFGVLSLMSYGVADLISSFEMVLLASTCSGIAQGIVGTALWSKTIAILRLKKSDDNNAQPLLLEVVTDENNTNDEKKCNDFSRDMSIFWLATLLPQILVPPVRSLLFFIFGSHETLAFATTWFISAFIVALALIPVTLYIIS